MREANTITKREEESGANESVNGEWGREKGTTSQLVADKTLVLLEEKTFMMEERRGQIKAKVNELINNKNVDSSARENKARAVEYPKAHRCTLVR